MLANDVLEKKLLDIAQIDHAKVSGDGYHYHVTLVSDEFLAKSKVARQQYVYKHIKKIITSGDLHALTMETFTNDEWKKQHG